MKPILLLCSLLPLVATAQELDIDKPLASDGEAALSPADKSQAEPAANVPETPTKLRTTLSLSDGGVLNGSLRQEALPVISDTLGSIRLDLHVVESIAFESAGGPARITFHNGDRLTARIAEDVDNLGIDTLLGSLSVPLSSISSFSIAPDAAWVNGNASLLYYCTFDSPAAIEHPAAGPAGRFLGGEFVPGKVGKALRIWADQSAAEVDFKPGMLGSRGTIEFWAKMANKGDDGFADSGNLRFFGLWLHAKGETPPWCSTHFQFTSNDGMGMSGLCGMVNHCSWATNPSFGGWPYAIIRDSLWDWHHYAVIWDSAGISSTMAPDGGPAVVEVFLDGKSVPTQGRQTVSFGGKHLKAIPSLWGKLAFPTPSNGWKSSGDHILFLIDEFKVWSVPKTEFHLGR